MTTLTYTSEPVGHHAPARRPTVCIVDDKAWNRESLARLLASPGWRTLTFPTAAAFLAHDMTSAPGCLVLDVELADMSGLELQARLATARPHIGLVFVSDVEDIPSAVKAMKAGAVEFFTRPLHEPTLREAVSAALVRSERALEQEGRAAMLRRKYQTLTRREREVMTLVAAGLLNKQVGGELGISEITVKAHRGQVMRKMQADSLPALVHMASRLALHEVAP